MVIGVFLIWFLLTNVNIGEMKAVMASANFWWFGIVIVVSVFSHVFRAMRWQLQLRAIGIEAPLSALINSIFGTYAVNLIFPRLGEVWTPCPVYKGSGKMEAEVTIKWKASEKVKEKKERERK